VPLPSESRSLAARFGENLMRQRRLADVSQEELAVLASLHRTEISQLERGMRIPRIDTVIKLARSLETSVPELLVGIDWEPGGTRRGRFKEREDQTQAGDSIQ
jgi:transcriptional regulator with XRE-family HTH domain